MCRFAIVKCLNYYKNSEQKERKMNTIIKLSDNELNSIVGGIDLNPGYSGIELLRDGIHDNIIVLRKVLEHQPYRMSMTVNKNNEKFF